MAKLGVGAPTNQLARSEITQDSADCTALTPASHDSSSARRWLDTASLLAVRARACMLFVALRLTLGSFAGRIRQCVVGFRLAAETRHLGIFLFARVLVQEFVPGRC